MPAALDLSAAEEGGLRNDWRAGKRERSQAPPTGRTFGAAGHSAAEECWHSTAGVSLPVITQRPRLNDEP